jgi:hypothetical protein
MADAGRAAITCLSSFYRVVSKSTASLDRLLIGYVLHSLYRRIRYVSLFREQCFSTSQWCIQISCARLVNYQITPVNGANLTNGSRLDQEQVILFSFGATSTISESLL